MATSPPVSLGSSLTGFGRAGLRAASALERRLPLSSTRTAAVGEARSLLQPAAIRIERTNARGRGRSSQTAVTLWFGTGPALPTPGLADNAALRMAMRLGAGLLAAAALGAVSIATERRALATRHQAPHLGAPRSAGEV